MTYVYLSHYCCALAMACIGKYEIRVLTDIRSTSSTRIPQSSPQNPAPATRKTVNQTANPRHQRHHRRNRNRKFNKKSNLSSGKSQPRSHSCPCWTATAHSTSWSTPTPTARYHWNGVTAMRRKCRMPRRSNSGVSARMGIRSIRWLVIGWRIDWAGSWSSGKIVVLGWARSTGQCSVLPYLCTYLMYTKESNPSMPYSRVSRCTMNRPRQAQARESTAPP